MLSMTFNCFKTFLISRILIFSALLGFSRCDLVFVNGEMYIVGLFDVFDEKDGRCSGVNTDSVMVLEAVRWYVEQLNEEKALPFKIGKMRCFSTYYLIYI